MSTKEKKRCFLKQIVDDLKDKRKGVVLRTVHLSNEADDTLRMLALKTGIGKHELMNMLVAKHFCGCGDCEKKRNERKLVLFLKSKYRGK